MGEPERKIERHWPAFLSRGHYAIFIGSFPVAFLIAQQIDAWLGVDILTLMVLVGYLFPLFDLSARRARDIGWSGHVNRSEEHTSELQSLMRISYAVFCLKKKNNN